MDAIPHQAKNEGKDKNEQQKMIILHHEKSRIIIS
jgi:hypothetical protein